MGKVVAITGGAGFVGRHLVARHVELGDTVRYLTRTASKSVFSGAQAFVGNLCSGEGLTSFASGADVLYHCAAELHDSSMMDEVNVRGTGRLLAVAEREIGLWVQLSSTGVYGPVRRGVVDEESVLAPVNSYEHSKAAADELVQAAATNGLQCIILRPSNIYGPDMPNQSLFQLIRMIDLGLFCHLSPREAVANYVHVSNVIDALVLCAERTLSETGRAYIVSDSCPMEQFVSLIARVLGRKVPRCRLPEWPVRMLARVGQYFPGFPLRESRIDALTNAVRYSSARIELELGYRNRVSLEDGVYEMVAAWKRWS
jgi:nucleoside-diphosphate-sugar epimerase